MAAINHEGRGAGKRGGDGDAVRPRTILHVDLDAFYAAVEVREQPALEGRPVVVGADPKGGRGRGVVAAASYAARRFGIRSAMPISEAYRRCPTAAYLRPRMDLYVEESRRFLRVLARFTDLIEPISIDEAFLDVTASRALYGDGEAIARTIKSTIAAEQRLTASIGVAPTKFIAKIASDIDKPDGLVVVAAANVAAFLDPLPVERLWGAGPKAVTRMRRLGAHTIGDLARLGEARLVDAFGESLGRHFHDLAAGIDPRRVVPDQERKSVGRESTFSEDVRDRRVVERRLFELLEEVAHRLRRAGLAGRVVTVKFRTSEFVTITRQARMPAPADTTETLWPIVKELLAKADDRSTAVRLIGVSVSSFGVADQLSLFDAPLREKRARIARAMDAVTERFGSGAIKRGGPSA